MSFPKTLQRSPASQKSGFVGLLIKPHDARERRARDSTNQHSQGGGAPQGYPLKMADPGVRNNANPEDLAVLGAFYRTRTGRPLWITEMGFSAKGQQALFEIEKADDWGLDPASFELPAAGDLPAGA